MNPVSRIASRFLGREGRSKMASDPKIVPVRQTSKLGLTKFGFSSKWGDFTIEFSHRQDSLTVRGTAVLEAPRLIFMGKTYTGISAWLENGNILGDGSWHITYVGGKNETDDLSFVRKNPTPGFRAFLASLAFSAIKDMVQDLLVDSDTSQLQSQKKRLERKLEELAEELETTKRELAEVISQLRNRNTTF